jgi:hypothetical protein
MEIQTCPRRDEIGSRYLENQDQWITDRWLTDPEEVEKYHKELDERFRTKFLNSQSTIYGPNSDLWLWTWGPPRTCDYCGSVHPEDALRLLSEGWEQEFAKSYKAYLHPPGYKTRLEAFLASIRDKNREPGEGVPSVWEPIPPVKLYMQHCTKEQVGQFNENLKRR